MEEPNQNVAKFKNIFIFYKSFFFIGSVFSVVLFLIIKSFFEEEKNFLSSFTENWQKRPILDVKLILNNNSITNLSNNKCPKNYEIYNLAEFPTDDSLCDCSESIFYDLSLGVLKPNKCSKFLYFIGCKDYSQFKNFNLKNWKNFDICVKRHSLTYLQINSQINPKNNQKVCNTKDTNNLNLNSLSCPLGNEEIYKIIKTQFKNSKNSNKTKEFRKSKFSSGLNNQLNLTTNEELKNYYLKYFNKEANNKILKNKAVSDIIISDSFPCLIPENYKRTNTFHNLFQFYLNNFDKIKNFSKNKLTNLTESPPSFITQEKTNDLFLENSSQEKCYFYQNAYYDKRFFILDKMKYIDYLNSGFLSNNTIINTNPQEIPRRLGNNLKSKKKKNFLQNKDNNQVYLISKPFFGWNKNFCKENPDERFDFITRIIKNASFHIDFFLIFKFICFLYIIFIIYMEKAMKDFVNGVYIGENKILRKIYVICDFLFSFLNLMNLVNLIFICANIRNKNNNYLDLIRNNCLDETSSKIVEYLSDSSEETIIYTSLILTLISIDTLIFCFILIKSYIYKMGFTEVAEEIK